MIHSFITPLVALSLWALACGTAWAVPWEELAPTQREALAPLRAHWGAMDAGQREKWLEVGQRFPALSSAGQQRLQARMAEWARRSPSERGQARLQFQEAQRWTPEERHERWEAYQSLAPQARQVLAERWKLEQAARARAGVAPAPADKRNVLEAPAPVVAPRQSATPTSVRARSGATTQPMSRPRVEPPHHQTGLPKIAATPSFVNPATLLPKQGPQGAAVTSPSVSAPKR